jgi:hypothetical protein
MPPGVAGRSTAVKLPSFRSSDFLQRGRKGVKG